MKKYVILFCSIFIAQFTQASYQSEEDFNEAYKCTVQNIQEYDSNEASELFKAYEEHLQSWRKNEVLFFYSQGEFILASLNPKKVTNPTMLKTKRKKTLQKMFEKKQALEEFRAGPSWLEAAAKLDSFATECKIESPEAIIEQKREIRSQIASKWDDLSDIQARIRFDQKGVQRGLKISKTLKDFLSDNKKLAQKLTLEIEALKVQLKALKES